MLQEKFEKKGAELVENNPKKQRDIRRYNAYAQYRDKLGVTDYYISKQSGVSASTLSEWSKGMYCPNADNLLKICEVINVPLEKILVE